MNPFRRILVTSALCLVAMGLSSCVTTVHRYVWNRARIVEEAYWVEDTENIELYRAGDTVYAKGFIGPARGGQETDDIPARALFVHGGAGPCFKPIKEQGSPVYIQVSGSYAKLRERAAFLHASDSGDKADEVLYVHWNSATYWPCLTELPAGAVRLSERGHGSNDIGWRYGDVAHTDAHQYYAYPLGALIALGVDVPLSLAGNVLLLGGAVVAIPCAGVYAAYEVCTQNAPDAESCPESTLQPSPVPSA